MPDPVTIAIWAATVGTINAINIVKSWIIELKDFVREVQTAAETIRRMENECMIFQADFELWAKMWGIDQDVSRRYLSALWGSTSHVITRQIELIRDTHQEIEQTFRKFRRIPPSSAAQTAGPQPKGMWKLVAFVSRTGPEIIRKQFRGDGRIPPSSAAQTVNPQLKGGWKSVTFVTQTGPEIIRKLETTQSQLARMKQLSRDAFWGLHRVQILEDITLEQAQQNILFQLVYESRLASKELYQICHRAREDFGSRDLKLEIDISRRRFDLAIPVNAQDGLPLRYHFLFTLLSELYERSVEGPIFPRGDHGPRQYAEVTADFYYACLATARMDQGYALMNVLGEADERWFHLHVPPASRRIAVGMSSQSFSQDEEFKPLLSLLYDLRVSIQNEPVDRFPRSERLRFAFKVAECGLFLSGTSWLTDLRSSNIRSARDSDDDRRFLLETKAFREGYNDGHFGQFAMHVFAIGILLAEIGIGRRVGNILRPSSTVGYTFHLYQAGINPASNPYEEPESSVLNTLQNNMGDKYAKAVKTCLHSRRSWKQAREHTPKQRSGIYQTMLKDYYFGVYSPLRNLQDQVDSEFNPLSSALSP